MPLLRLLAGRPLRYALLTTLWTVLRSTILLTGLLLKSIFDVLAGESVLPSVWLLIGALVLSEAVRLYLWYGVILSKLEPSYTYEIRAGLRSNALDRLLRRPGAIALDRPAGDVISRLGGDADELGIFAIWSASNLSRLIVASVALTIMITIDPLVTAGLVVPIILITVVGYVMNGPIGRYRAAARRSAGDVATLIGEAAGGFQSLKVARAEQRVVARLRRLGDERRRVSVREETLTSLQDALFRSTAALGTGCLLLLAAGRMRDGLFTVGDLTLFLFYIQLVTEAVNALGTMLGRIKKANLSMERITDLTGDVAETVLARPVYLDREPPPWPPAPAREPLLSLSVAGLSYSFPGTGGGIENADLAIEPGTLTVVTGKVGAGKSTLIKALLGLLPAQRGEIRWNGTLVTDPAEFLVPPRVAYVPQAPRLFSGTLRENITLGEPYDDAEVVRALRLAAFARDLDDLAEGLDTVIGPRGLRLSGGQSQRVAAARALVREPELLVIDDLSNALDLDTERRLWDNLLTPGRTVLAISSRPELLSRADHVVLAQGGALEMEELR